MTTKPIDSSAARRASVMLAAATDAGEPATEIRLFKLGKNETTKGTFTLTKASAKLLLKQFAEYGNDLAVDYEHQTFDAGNGPVPAAGWIRQGCIELRADGLWAKVEWTARALELIAAKEYRYFSPTFFTNADGEIVKLAPLALVNYPATHDMEPLIAATARDGRTDQRVQLMAFADITAALWRTISARFGYDACVCDVFDDVVIYAFQSRMWSCGYVMDGSAAVLVGDTTEVERAYAPVSMVNAASGQDRTSPENADMKLLTSKLGLVEGASEPLILSAVETLQTGAALSADVLKLTGKASSAEALGVIHSWKATAEKVPGLEAEVSAMNKRTEDTERAAIFTSLRAAKKITPAQEKAFAEWPVAQLKSFADTAPVIPVLATAAVREPQGTNVGGEPMKHDGKTYGQMSIPERKNLLLTDEVTFRALKEDFKVRNPHAFTA